MLFTTSGVDGMTFLVQSMNPMNYINEFLNYINEFS